MAKRPRFSRWRRLPPVFRTGEHRPIGSGNELDRIILYVPARALDLAEALAEKAGIPAIQEYCGQLLTHALEVERDQQKVIEIEARRGPLEGLKQIAQDADYLAEWQAESESRPAAPPPAVDALSVDFVLADEPETVVEVPTQPALEGEGVRWLEEAPEGDRDRAGRIDRPAGPDESRPAAVAVPAPRPATVRVVGDPRALDVLWRHAGLAGDDWGFLPCLRRGVPVPPARSAELIRALQHLELDLRDSAVLDRRMAHALHRLALESQVLLTDAWPGVFDGAMIATIRTVQEAVERVLSGQDIRY